MLEDCHVISSQDQTKEHTHTQKKPERWRLYSVAENSFSQQVIICFVFVPDAELEDQLYRFLRS